MSTNRSNVYSSLAQEIADALEWEGQSIFGPIEVVSPTLLRITDHVDGQVYALTLTPTEHPGLNS